ncbi:MAG: hypothetical protein QM820_65495 [Minicystis sp.]
MLTGDGERRVQLPEGAPSGMEALLVLGEAAIKRKWVCGLGHGRPW